jgi:hypothetical protein
VRLASRGQREVNDRIEAIEEPGLAGRLRRQGRQLHVQALLAAAALTTLVLLLPG